MEGIVAGELFFAASGESCKKVPDGKMCMKIRTTLKRMRILLTMRRKLKDQKLPQMKKGERLHIENVSMNTGRTKPPARFTEATLLAAMENPVRYMESHDTKAAKTLGETGGLGTVATRAGYY